MKKYILNKKGEPEVCNNLMEWAKWFETMYDARIVKKSQVGKREVSTVFLAIDHSFSGDDSIPPLLYETMIFPSEEDVDYYQERCSTREQSLEQHQKAIQYLEDKFNESPK